jgi:hypothetical protein
MIWRVAEPMLEGTPNYESKQVILNLTALAWNFNLFDPIKEEEMLAEIAICSHPTRTSICSNTSRTVRRFSSSKRNALSARSKRDRL